ncbi:MAG: hypothetical protein IJ858_09765 [Acidaminococcaceae bacterium]|nr:hypothetical protein [Acidaminococcaceae bacterium]
MRVSRAKHIAEGKGARREAEGALLARILDRDNLNRAYKRVKANKGAPGIDGMDIEPLYG